MLKKKLVLMFAASSLLLATSTGIAPWVLAEEMTNGDTVVEDYGGGTNTDTDNENYYEGMDDSADINADLIAHTTSTSAKIRVVYSNGLAVDEGTLVKLNDGGHQIEQATDANGYVEFSLSDGLEDQHTYQISVGDQMNVSSFTAQGQQELTISVKLPGADDPLSLNLKLAYEDGSLLPVGSNITFTNLKDGSQFEKTISQEGQLMVNEMDGLKKTQNYGLSVDGTNIGSTFRYDLGGVKELRVTIPDYAKPIEVGKIALVLRYTNGLPVEKGTTVKLSYQDQEISKQIEQAGELTITEEDGLILGQEYKVSVDDQADLLSLLAQADQSYRVTVALKGANDPLQVDLILTDAQGNKLSKGSVLTFRDLKSGQSFEKTLTEDGQLSVLETDGLKKEVNYGISVDGTNIGYTFRYDLGGKKTLKVELPATLANKEYTTDSEKDNSQAKNENQASENIDTEKPDSKKTDTENTDTEKNQEISGQVISTAEEKTSTEVMANDKTNHASVQDSSETMEAEKTSGESELMTANKTASTNSKENLENSKQKLPNTGESSALNVLHLLAILSLLASLSLFKKLSENK